MGNPTLQPLHGIGILVTRAKEQSADILSELKSFGARVYAVPAIRIEHFPDPPGLSDVLLNIRTYDHLVFTSVNGVYSFLRHIGASDSSPGEMPSALCVGPKTAEAWRKSGGTVRTVPGKYSAMDLAGTLGDNLDGVSLLILRPEHIETSLGMLLRQRGARTDEVILYKAVTGEESPVALESLLENGELDVVLFASPSAVYGIVSMAGGPEVIKDLFAVCIGPTTAKAAVESGFAKVVFPEDYTSGGMIGALLARAGEIRDRR